MRRMKERYVKIVQKMLIEIEKNIKVLFAITNRDWTGEDEMGEIIIKEVVPEDAEKVIAYMKIIGGVSANLSGLPRRMSHRAEMGISVLKNEWNNGIGAMLM